MAYTYKTIGFKHPNSVELKKINNFKQIIVDTAQFYENKLSKGNINYVYKNKNQLKLIKVHYGANNFMHLIGIRSPNKTATEAFNIIKRNKFDTKKILIKNDNTTFEKLEKLNNLKKLINPNYFILHDLSQVKQADKLKFTKAIKSNSRDFLLALKDFEPEIYTHKSLLNLDKKYDTNIYKNVPENSILGIYKEEKDDFDGLTLGVNAGVLAINHKYLKDSTQIQQMTSLVQKELLKDALNLDTKSLQNNKSKRIDNAKRAFLRKRGLERD